MSSTADAEFELEIAHILFIDTVGYSKLLMNEQRQVMAELNQVVRSTETFRAAEAEGKLVRLPTGDGMALIFSGSPQVPLHCAIEISRILVDHPSLKIRMGIHSGPVSRVVDVNDRENIAGAGINIAQRVMSCGDAGHILLSKRTADDLMDHPHWHESLTEVGECEVKHGHRLSLVSFCDGQAGNPTLPGAIQRLRDREASERAVARVILRRWRWVAGALSVALLSLALAVYATFHWRKSGSRDSVNLPEKSIAVLPFENLSDEKQNAFLAEGIMDEILTNLAKVADLKVISRTSVMQYRADEPRNVREIAASLGVAHILEGSVQRLDKNLRVTAQLIDARTDTHVWAQRYDRQIADVFAIESELAESIVRQLRSKLSAEEKAAIETPPTNDLIAYNFYLKAKSVLSVAALNIREKEKLFEAEDLLKQAVARDPTFFLAFYHLARTHDRLYILGIDHTPERLQMAEAAIENALRLRPEAGEGHLALAAHRYTKLDYQGAREELDIAGRALPNEPLVFELTGYMDRRQNRWEECVINLERALNLDPNNYFILQQIALATEYMRRFPQMAASLDRALSLVPKDPGSRVYRGFVDLEWRADTGPLRAAVEGVIQDNPKDQSGIAQLWLYLGLCERNFPAVTQALSVMTNDGCRVEGVPLPKAWCEGVAARARGDSTAAKTAFTAARLELEKSIRNQPDYAEALCALGLVDSGLGRKEEAIGEGERAVQLLPAGKDAINGGLLLEYLAIIYAWTGETDRALQQLEIVTKIPCDVSYGQLRLHPYWDPLRGDPRFDKIVQSLAPD